jgi:hypothetical protein
MECQSAALMDTASTLRSATVQIALGELVVAGLVVDVGEDTEHRWLALPTTRDPLLNGCRPARRPRLRAHLRHLEGVHRLFAACVPWPLPDVRARPLRSPESAGRTRQLSACRDDHFNQAARRSLRPT